MNVMGHVHDDHGADDLVDESVSRWLWIGAAVCAALTLIGAIVLWPGDDQDRVLDPAGLSSDPVGAVVREATLERCSYDATTFCRALTIEITEGDTAGAAWELEQPSNSPLREGDDILVTLAELPDGTVIYSFYDYERSTPLVALVILFVVCVLLLGRWRGLGAIGGLAASLFVLISFMLPSLLDGNSPVAVALVSAGAIAFIALYLAHGFTAATNVALLSTFASLLITGTLAWIFIRAANFTGFTDESTFFLDALGVSVDARGILLAGIVIGSLGVLDDVTVTQVSAVGQLRRTKPDASAIELYRSALTIGRDHISSTVNTLVLAYAGASLPLLLLFTEADQGFGAVAMREIVAVEVVRALVGSIGLVASVPISTWLAARVFTTTNPSTPRPPRKPRARERPRTDDEEFWSR
jgi:uncharacterized membrane protein